MQPKRRRKHRFAAPIGGVFLLLTAIGIITVIISSLQLTDLVLDNSKEKKMFEQIIQPVLMFDPAPFETPVDIEMNNLLLYSMWATLTNERAKNYNYGDNLIDLMVPASDLDVAAATLFGPDVKLVHQTFSDYYTSYVYDSKKNMYSILVSAQLYVYTPEVREVVKEGDLYRLDVYYIPPGDAWTMTFAGDKLSSNYEKHMYYYVKKYKNTYQLVKLTDPPSQTDQAIK